ncbi:hypothetical protein ACWCSH_46940, partial [Streptosporangium sp. NPDC001682]
ERPHHGPDVERLLAVRVGLGGDPHPASTTPAATTTTPALPILRRPIESSKRADDTLLIPL